MKRSGNPYLGFDLGASNGRAVVGFLDKGRLHIEELHRFPNEPVQLGETLYWNFLSLWSNVLESLQRCARRGYTKLSGIGVDTWGVDFGLIGKEGGLWDNPIHYRNTLTEGVEKIILRKISAEELYRLTGQGVSRVSTLSQLIALQQGQGKGLPEAAHIFLTISDLFRYFLCGKPVCEKTAVSDSQLVNVRSGKWCSRIFETFNLPLRIFPPVIEPATLTGTLRPEVSKITGIQSAPVIAVAGHDTASAAAALPFADSTTAFVSCGTWAMLGTITDLPVLSNSAMEAGFCNVFGVNSILLLKGLSGLYLAENLRRTWVKRKGEIPSSKLVQEASAAKPFRLFIDPESPIFFNGRSPEELIFFYLRSTKQKENPPRGQIIRAILEGLAFNFRRGLSDLAQITGRKFSRLCLVGGGSNNRLLCRMASDATGLEVIAGPAEATVVGNMAMQALATGELSTAEEIRTLVQSSFRLTRFTPKGLADWNGNFQLYREITGYDRK